MRKYLRLFNYTLLISMCACAPFPKSSYNINPNFMQGSTHLTGGLKTDPVTNIQSPYTDTVSSDSLQNVKDKLQSEWKQKGIAEQSQSFTKSIGTISLQMIRDQVKKPVSLKAQVVVGDITLKFTAKITNGILDPTYSSNTSMTNYSISGTCVESDCSEIKLFLSHFDESKNLIEKAGFVYRKMRAKLQAILPDQQKNVKDARLNSFYQQYKEEKEIDVEDVVIANGSSTSRVNLSDGTKILNLDIPNEQTDEVTPPEVTISNQPSGSIHATLLGNTGVASDTNSLAPKAANNMILLQGKSGERVYAKLSRSEVKEKAPVPTLSDKGFSNLISSYFIPINTKIPKAVNITKSFEKYRSWSGLELATKDFLVKFDKASIQNFLNNLKSPMPVFQKVCDSAKVPCTFIYLLVNESANMKSKTKSSNLEIGADCEVGPFQLMYGTAMGLSANIFQVEGRNTNVAKRQCRNQKTNYVVNQNDDRLYLEPSVQMAAKYLSKAFDRYSSDPALAIMDYNQGAPAVSKTLNNNESTNFSALFIQDLKNFNYQTVAGYHLNGVEYVNNFLAMYFIGANPEQNGFKRDQDGIEFTCEEIYSPTEITNGACK